LPLAAPALNFWPQRPQPIAPICRILERLGMRIAFEPRADQPMIAWETDTWFAPRLARRLPDDAINGRCLDVSKSRVAGAWAKVSGYPLAVDPTQTHGPMVEKPEENARHGGRLVDGPLARPRRGHVYQRLVDSRIGDQIHQLRAIVMGGAIVLAYEKWRPDPMWFTGTQLTVPHAASEIFSAPEQALVLAMAAEMGVDYAEIDVLRDEPTGLIYVVDVNRTPARPHNLPEADQKKVYDIQAEGFLDLLRVTKSRWEEKSDMVTFDADAHRRVIGDSERDPR
jgi:hypothetical protein